MAKRPTQLALSIGAVAALFTFTLCCATSTTTKQPPAATAATEIAEPAVAQPSTPPTTSAPAPEPEAVTPEELAARVVGAGDRDPADRKKDDLRKPQQLLAFAGLQPGMRVADLGAGGGYTTELLARAVGPTGKVFAQNTRATIERFVKQAWPARLDKPVMSNVVRVDAELEAPLPDTATELDLVTMIFFYHDAVALKADVGAMNQAIFKALKPGGLFIIADHYARDGSGTADTPMLHRIDPEAVKAQVTAAGFELVEGAEFLRDPADTRDWEVWKRGFKTDRFVLKFKKPEA